VDGYQGNGRAVTSGVPVRLLCNIITDGVNLAVGSVVDRNSLPNHLRRREYCQPVGVDEPAQITASTVEEFLPPEEEEFVE
jgi:hypothetical protein